MGKMINRGNELLRVSPEHPDRLEYSTNNGGSWYTRCSSGPADFRDLLDRGKEILAATSKGVYYSPNDGGNWYRRCSGSPCEDFQELSDNGNEILATTSNGLYYSPNDGGNWYRK